MSRVILNRFLSVSAGGKLGPLPGWSILDGPRASDPSKPTQEHFCGETKRRNGDGMSLLCSVSGHRKHQPVVY